MNESIEILYCMCDTPKNACHNCGRTTLSTLCIGCPYNNFSNWIPRK